MASIQERSPAHLDFSRAAEFAGTQKFLEEFVNNPANRIPLSYHNRDKETCGDGRTGRAVGATRPLRQFGGTVSDYTAAIASLRAMARQNNIQLPWGFQQLVLHTVVGAIGGKENFYLHTDTNHGHQGVPEEIMTEYLLQEGQHYHAPRCGDYHQKLTDLAAYGLSVDDMRTFIAAFRPDGVLAGLEHDPLEGRHAEKGLVVLRSPDTSIQAQCPDGNQVFVLTQTLIDERNVQIADALSQEFRAVPLPWDEFGQSYGAVKDAHHKITAHKLAPGAPIFDINIPSFDAPAVVQYAGVT